MARLRHGEDVSDGVGTREYERPTQLQLQSQSESCFSASFWLLAVSTLEYVFYLPIAMYRTLHGDGGVTGQARRLVTIFGPLERQNSRVCRWSWKDTDNPHRQPEYSTMPECISGTGLSGGLAHIHLLGTTQLSSGALLLGGTVGIVCNSEYLRDENKHKNTCTRCRAVHLLHHTTPISHLDQLHNRTAAGA